MPYVYKNKNNIKGISVYNNKKNFWSQQRAFNFHEIKNTKYEPTKYWQT